MDKKISNISITENLSILSVLKKMDELKVKLLLVFNESKFVGIITIGDIQRAIIKNISLDNSISTIICHKKIYARPTDNIDKIKKNMLRIRTECMPVVDEEGRLTEVYFWKDLFQEESLKREPLNLPVVIMAGGKGTRLKPLTNVIPKPLIPIGRKTILEEIMDQFESIGCTEFHMSVNYKYDIIKYYLGQLDHKSH